MAKGDKIKVIGYAQKVFFNDNIEYRNFSEDLVGNQQTEGSDGNSSQFTNGNFSTSTNFDGRASRRFGTNKFSDYFCLENLSLTEKRAKLLANPALNVTLNMDPTNLCSFAYFGSANEFVRVTLEKIITDWPASLHLDPITDNGTTSYELNTFEDYIYDASTNKSTFKVNTNLIDNKFGVIYQSGVTTEDTFNESNTLRNLTLNYESYVILINDSEYQVLGFTGSTNLKNDYIYFEVIGDPFDTLPYDTINYHIKPNRELGEEFFYGLSDFEGNLLNRLSNPKYTSKYTYKEETENGLFIIKDEILTWPVTDGYNIDFNTTEYTDYVTRLIKISNSKDAIDTNLMVRFLTSESISDFDTVPRCDGEQEETAGHKMNSTLKVYGREFDEIKRYTDGISFANIVSYDKKNNTPDEMVKYLARVVGWELTSSLLDTNLAKQYLDPKQKTYAGYSRGLTPNEAEIEMWRRLILNSAWIWKSKGTRKAIEFFFSFIGAPDGLINFNEYVYKVKEPLDMNLFYAVLENNNLSTNLSGYTVDDEGYPKFLRDNGNMYFQKGGGWYRQTAGSGATQYILNGNNPHVGPYDSGKEYINQLENIVPSFTAFTLTSTTITSGTTQLFTNYNQGIMNSYSGSTYVGVQNDEGVDLSDLVKLNTRIMTDPCPTAEETECGCDVPENDESLIIDVLKTNDLSVLETSNIDCTDLVSDQTYNEDDMWDFDYIVYERNGNVSDMIKRSEFISPECCVAITTHNSYYYETYINNIPDPFGIGAGSYDWELRNAGYVCCASQGISNDLGKDGCGCKITCQWLLAGPTLNDTETISGNRYLKFIDPSGNFRVVNESDSCFCPIQYTTGVVIEDPYTGDFGYGCRLKEIAYDIFNSTPTEDNILYDLFYKKANGLTSCKADTNNQT